MMPKKSLSIIIVNYRSQHHLERCLASVFSKVSPEVELEVILVNNDKNENLSNFSQKYPAVKLVDHGENLGFGGGNNLGAKEASSEFLFFLNPDTEIATGVISAVLKELEENSEIGMIGSELVDFSGKVQPWSCGYEVNWLNLLLNNLGLSRSRHLWEQRKKVLVDWVSGTAFFMKKELFLAIGGFDEKIFMYFEDVDLSRRVRAMGKKVLYNPDFSVKHYCGGSQTDARSYQKKIYYDSQEYYFKKHHSPVSFWILKLIRKIFYLK